MSDVKALLADLAESPAFMADALCIEYPAVEFFPRKGQTAGPARAVCAVCLVVDECLRYALAIPGMPGVWGGTIEQERRRMQPRAAPVPHPCEGGCGRVIPGRSTRCSTCRNPNRREVAA